MAASDPTLAVEDMVPPRDPPSLRPPPDHNTRDFLRDVELERLKLQNRALLQDIEHRDKYANRLFVALCVWMIAVLDVLYLQGYAAFGFKLDKEVVIALLGTTTVNVIGLFIVVARSIFPNRDLKAAP